MASRDGGSATADGVEELVWALTDAPRRLASLTRGLDDDRLARRPADDAWSANEILAHLRACADVWGGSIAAMIERDHPIIRYVSPRTWIRKTNYVAQPFSDSLQAFVEQRTVLLHALDGADWSRGATFTGTTRGREQTILLYVRRLADHEREHLAQLAATVHIG